MPVFAVFEVSNPDAIRSKLNLYHRDSYLEVSPSTFFVADRNITSVQLGGRLGLATPEVQSRAVIVPVTSYWGYHDRSVWEWIAAKQIEYG